MFLDKVFKSRFTYSVLFWALQKEGLEKKDLQAISYLRL